MPAALAGLSGTFSSIAPKAASIRDFWPGYWRIRISRAAAAAATSADAFGFGAMSGAKRAYRFSTALTESDIDTCMIARLRVHGLPETFTAFMTSMAVWVQSVMTSARACVAPEISIRLTTVVLIAFIVASLMRFEQLMIAAAGLEMISTSSALVQVCRRWSCNHVGAVSRSGRSSALQGIMLCRVHSNCDGRHKIQQNLPEGDCGPSSLCGRTLRAPGFCG